MNIFAINGMRYVFFFFAIEYSERRDLTFETNGLV